MFQLGHGGFVPHIARQPISPHLESGRPRLLPLGLAGQFKVSSDSVLSPSERKDDWGEVTVLDHFTFLGEISELEARSLLGPREADKCTLELHRPPKTPLNLSFPFLSFFETGSCRAVDVA